MGSILGGLLGGGSSPGQEAQMNAIHGSVQDYQTYRQEAAQALLNTLNQANSAYQGTNNALETLYGQPTQKQGNGLPSFGAPLQRAQATAQPSPSPSRTIGSAAAGFASPMNNAQRHREDPVQTAVGAVFDPAGLFTKGIGGLF